MGDLLFSRAGVRVRAPRHLIDAAVATTSTLYFTFGREPVDPADCLTSPDPLDERRELPLHLRFVRTALPRDEDDRFPFGGRLSLNS